MLHIPHLHVLYNKKYPTITETIFKCFIFYNKQKKKKYNYNVQIFYYSIVNTH